MSKIDIIRAWKDPEYRASLSESEIAQLPEHPSGLIELDDDDMSSFAGGMVADPTHTKSCPHCCKPPSADSSIELL